MTNIEIAAIKARKAGLWIREWASLTTGLEGVLLTEAERDALVEATSPPDRVRDVTCPQCRKAFELTWEGYGNKRVTLILNSCPSGGIYNVSIACPHCNYVEEL
jgi:hypothetical protein